MEAPQGLPHRPTGFPSELHGSGSRTLRKWARSAGRGDGRMASPSCMNNSLFTKSDFSYAVPETCFWRHRLCTQDGNDFLMTLRGLVSRQQ